MKIAESAIQLTSQHVSVEKHQKQEYLAVWGPGEEPLPRSLSNNQGREIDIQKEISTLNQSSRVELSKQALHASKTEAVGVKVSEESEAMRDLNIRILKAMIERITGKKIHLNVFRGVSNAESDKIHSRYSVVAESPSRDSENESKGGLVYDSYESHYEYESSSFSSNGTILTEDGKQIEFSVDLHMSREFFSEEKINIRAGDALKDPLVVNFSGEAAQLTQDTFSFDIDNNGFADQISFLRPGSGFLALDKNEDNFINNGSELFGPVTGQGFEELAAYDLDGNRWIDENDSIFHKLRIWTKDAEGNDILFALGEKGIGAISLDSTTTLFSMKDASNNLLGQVKETGVFLGESGDVGTVQQIDLVA